MPARLSMARLMFADLGAFLPFPQRLALSNLWLFRKTVMQRLRSTPITNAIIRTTMAATVIQGGIKDNLLPARAEAVVNCRLLPGDTREQLVDHIRKVVNDEAVQINAPDETTWDPSPVSPVDSPVYQSLTQTIRQVFPEAVVAPFLFTMATDSRHYTRLCDCVYRFTPYTIDPDLYKSIHGVDERIAVEALAGMVQFYIRLIKSWTTVVGMVK